MLPALTIEVSSFEEPGAREGHLEFEARIFVDGHDWLGDEFLGLDPVRLREELGKGVYPHVVVGRCHCGCEGCGDKVVEVTRTETRIVWSSFDAVPIEFDAKQYDSEIARFVGDMSWETIGRTVERLVGQVLQGMVLADDFAFAWASARPSEKVVVLMFRSGHTEKVFELDWDGTSTDSAIEAANSLRRDRCLDQ